MTSANPTDQAGKVYQTKVIKVLEATPPDPPEPCDAAQASQHPNDHALNELWGKEKQGACQYQKHDLSSRNGLAQLVYPET